MIKASVEHKWAGDATLWTKTICIRIFRNKLQRDEL